MGRSLLWIVAVLLLVAGGNTTYDILTKHQINIYTLVMLAPAVAITLVSIYIMQRLAEPMSRAGASSKRDKGYWSRIPVVFKVMIAYVILLVGLMGLEKFRLTKEPLQNLKVEGVVGAEPESSNLSSPSKSWDKINISPECADATLNRPKGTFARQFFLIKKKLELVHLSDYFKLPENFVLKNYRTLSEGFRQKTDPRQLNAENRHELQKSKLEWLDDLANADLEQFSEVLDQEIFFTKGEIREIREIFRDTGRACINEICSSYTQNEFFSILKNCCEDVDCKAAPPKISI